MTDALYLGMIVLLFAITWGIVKLCDVLRSDAPGDKS
jgi:hypothetical protein